MQNAASQTAYAATIHNMCYQTYDFDDSICSHQYECEPSIIPSGRPLEVSLVAYWVHG